MASSSTMIVAVASALCVHTILAYPTAVGRVPGDNNYLPLRNSPSRDLDRFIDTFCNDGNQCNLPSGMLAAAAWDSLDRLNGGHVMVAKRSLDRLNGGHVMVTKRSLNRLDGGHVMVAKRSLDRLNGGHVMVERRSTLDRLNSIPIMTKTRSTLDRLNGSPVMVARRSTLDRLNGRPVKAAKRSQPELFDNGLTVVTGGLLPVRGQLESVPQQLQQQPPKYPRTLTRSETDMQSFNDNDRDDYFSKNDNDYYVQDYDGDDCQGCGSWAKASSF